MIRRLGQYLSASPEPPGVIKSARPLRCVSASPEGHVEPLGKTGSHGGP
jgi:hypothetical protein